MTIANTTSTAVLLAFLAAMNVATLAYAAEAGTPADGAKIYKQACAKCHSGGPGGFFTGAPKIGGSYWEKRMKEAGSINVLLDAVIKGKGKMPPQGGSAGLSDADLRAAVDFMLAPGAKPE